VTLGYLSMSHVERKTPFSLITDALGVAGGLLSVCLVLLSGCESLGHVLVQVRLIMLPILFLHVPTQRAFQRRKMRLRSGELHPGGLWL